MKAANLVWIQIGKESYITESVKIHPGLAISYQIRRGSMGIYVADHNYGYGTGTEYHYVGNIREAMDKAQELFNKIVEEIHSNVTKLII